MFQDFINRIFVASCDLDIVYKKTEFPIHKAFIDVISVIRNQIDTFLITHIAVIFHIGLFSVDLTFQASRFPILEKEIVQLLFEVGAEKIRSRRDGMIRTWEQNDFFLL